MTTLARRRVHTRVHIAPVWVAAAIALLLFAAAAHAFGAQRCNGDDDNAAIVCPVCHDAGQTSRSYQGTYPGHPYGVPSPSVLIGNYGVILTPAIYTSPAPEPEPLHFWDEGGCFHDHDRSYQSYHCSRGHEWRVYADRCWCGWPENLTQVIKGG